MKKIHFRSEYSMGDNTNLIEFSSRLEIDEYQDMKALIFEQKNEDGKIFKSRIEYNENKASIHSAAASLDLEKGRITKNIWYANNLQGFIYTFLHDILIEDNKIELFYEVSADDSFDDAKEIHLILVIEDTLENENN